MRKYLETNENVNATYQNIWNAAKAVPRGRFIGVNTYTKKEWSSQINNLYFLLKVLENEDQTKTQARRREEIRAKINEIENIKTIEKNEIKTFFFLKKIKLTNPKID